jgi:hypothetical protein
MTGYIAYEANRARQDDFHRRAGEHRGAAAARGARGEHSRGLARLVTHRRRRATTRTATTAA